MPVHQGRNTGELVGFDIAKFNSVVNEAGILKPTKWMFSTTVPNGLMNNGDFALQAARNVQFWASAATIPGATMVTHDTMRYGYGVAVKRPYSPAFGPMQIEFTADGMGAEWTFFKQWLNLIIEYDARSGVYSMPNGTKYVYEVAYAEDYTVDCVVSAFVDTGEEVLRVILREAYPIALSDMRMDWADTGGAARFRVSMHFVDWYQENLGIQGSLGVATE